jgi:hypothetical protein
MQYNNNMKNHRRTTTHFGNFGKIAMTALRVKSCTLLLPSISDTTGRFKPINALFINKKRALLPTLVVAIQVELVSTRWI